MLVSGLTQPEKKLQPLADKASRLFQYLAEVQKLNERPVRSVSAYRQDGAVYWLSGLAQYATADGKFLRFEESLSKALQAKAPGVAADGAGLVAVLRRPPHVKFPEPSGALLETLAPGFRNPHKKPTLAPAESDPRTGRRATPSAKTEQEFRDWLGKWEHWAENERYKQCYQAFFELQTRANQQTDEFELLLGAGHLAWDVDHGVAIERPVFTSTLSMEMKKTSGQIEIRLADGEVRVELDMIPPEKIADNTFVNSVKAQVEKLEDTFPQLSGFTAAGSVVANTLSTDGVFSDSATKPEPQEYPVVAWAPSIILRRRRVEGLANSFAGIAQNIADTGTVPDGLKVLIDPNQTPKVANLPGSGALFRSGSDWFSPLPLNARQLEVLERVDRNAQTIVQGPPGTGKTHMAAALLSHLLAQGKRVLVTAETERALYELRGKMPKEIQELAVTVIGSGKEDKADLKVAIDTIHRRASGFQEKFARKKIKRIENRLKGLDERRSDAVDKWVALFAKEGGNLRLPGYKLPRAEAARRWLEEPDNILGFSNHTISFHSYSPLPL